MDSFEKLVRLIERRYYGDLIMGVFELIAIIIGLLFARKDKIGIFFLVYLIFDFLILISDYYLEVSSSFTRHEVLFFENLTNGLISLIELLVYYYFFFNIIHNTTIIALMKTFRAVFIFIVIISITTEFSFLTKRYTYIVNFIGAVEFLFLIPPCFAYFFELLQNDPVINLYERPSFWIVTGLFFYSVVSIPDYLIDRFVNINQHKYWFLITLLFLNIPIAINSIFLTRAFLCRKRLSS